ncbi:MAG TPA: T9SS type A sorting domain-containing protein, partial [Draconibacterium sp.]|nr:T9SS type A sorting domain-containing protein [Draconibacterium sp.]
MGKPAEETIKMYFSNMGQNLVVSHNEHITNVRIYGITGQLLVNREFNQAELKTDTSFLKNGIYIVTVLDAKNMICTKK